MDEKNYDKFEIKIPETPEEEKKNADKAWKLRNIMTRSGTPFSVKMEEKEKQLYYFNRRLGSFMDDDLIIRANEIWREKDNALMKSFSDRKNFQHKEHLQELKNQKGKKYDFTIDCKWNDGKYQKETKNIVVRYIGTADVMSEIKLSPFNYDVMNISQRIKMPFAMILQRAVGQEIKKGGYYYGVEIEKITIVSDVEIRSIDPNRRKMRFVNFKYDNRGFGKIDDSGECVINLLKQYKSRDYIVNWFQEKLDMSEYELNIGGLDNYEVLHFCNEHKINMYAVDLLYNKCLTNTVESDDRKHQKSLIYASGNGHCYEVVDQSLRHAIANRSFNKCLEDSLDKSVNKVETSLVATKKIANDGKSQIMKAKPLKLNEEYFSSTDLFNVVDDLKAGKYYIVDSNGNNRHSDISDVFHAIYENADLVCQNRSANNMMVYLKYQSVELYYNPKVKECLVIGAIVNCPDAYRRSLAHLFRRLLPKYNLSYDKPLSSYNKRTVEIFNYEATAAGLIWAPESVSEEQMATYKKKRQLLSVDYSKQYSHIMKTYYLPKYSCHDTEEEFQQGSLSGDKIGFYYLKFSNEELKEQEQATPPILRGSGYYCSESVKYALECKLCTVDNIKTQVLASQKVKLNRWVDVIFEKEPTVSKMAVCILAGSLGMRNAKLTNAITVNNPLDASYYAYKYNGMVKGLGNNLFNVSCKEEIHLAESGRPAFLTITQIGNVLAHKLAMKLTKLNGRILAMRVDSVHYLLSSQREQKKVKEILDVKSKKDAKIGDIRKEKHKEKINEIPWKISSNAGFFKKKLFNLQWQVCELEEWEPDDDFMFKDFAEDFCSEGCLIHGLAGAGKSVFSEKLIQAFESLGKKAQKLAFTNVAANNIDGQTLHNFIQINVEKGQAQQKRLNQIAKWYDYLLVDECSMLDDMMLRILQVLQLKGCKIILVGDYWQLPPVGSQLNSSEMYESPMIKSLCNNRVIQLTENYRADKKFVEECRSGLYDEKSFRTDDDLDILNIVKYNKTREMVNRKCAEKYGNMGQIGSRFVVKKKTKIRLSAGANNRWFHKNSIFKIVKENKIKELYRKSQETIQLTKDDMQLLLLNSELGYAITTYKAQGMTIKDKYTIWDYPQMNENHKYVAMTRTTDRQKIKLKFNQAYTERTGLIYKMVGCETGLIYIGQTFKTIEKRFEEHKEDTNKLNDKLHKQMRKEEFKITQIKKIKNSNEEELNYWEQFYIDKYNITVEGLNSRDQCVF